VLHSQVHSSIQTVISRRPCSILCTTDDFCAGTGGTVGLWDRLTCSPGCR
jgi:hypothetical protein